MDSHKDPESHELLSPSKSQVKLSEDAAAKEAPGRVQAFWLLIWMINNILVTVLNKAAFAKVDFKYPYTLSAIHMACNIVGTQIYFLFWKNTKQKQLEGTQWRSVIFFSVIFALNIAIGNISLRYVSVNFNQVCRALVPVITMVISMVAYRKSYSSERKYAVIPIVLGVALAFYGDMTFSAIGVFYIGACVVLAALKAVLGGELLTGDLKLHEMDLLAKMCPVALIICGVAGYMSGELEAIGGRWEELAVGSAPQVVLITGVLSFFLNVSSFIANKVTSPLTLCISANVKQVLVVAVSTLYFNDPMPFLNGLGILVVIYGSYRYGAITISERGSG